MRTLTIKRTKSFVGCLVKLKIYIEDPASGELVINNVPCRKIGEIKNGEEQSFQIGEQAVKVFAIADKLSKDYCNDCYQIPAGQEDIYLSGKCKFNLGNGNAFRFDNNDSEQVAANRKRGSKIGWIVMAVALLVGLVIGSFVGNAIVSNSAPKEKTFSYDEMSIVLTDRFAESKVGNYDFAYGSNEVAVFGLKEAFALADGFGDYTLEQYADLVIQANSLSCSPIKTDDGLICFEYDYTNPDNKAEYHYCSYVYKSKEAFWTLQFATLKSDVEKYSQNINDWAKSVTFSD